MKTLYSRKGSRTEAAVEGFVVDILHSDGSIVEIQTAALSRAKRKLAALVHSHQVTLVYPLAIEKRLVVYDAEQRKILRERMSPRRRAFPNVFKELVGLSRLLANDNLELHVLLTREQEVRRADGRGSWRRKGITIVDRRLVEITEQIRFRNTADYLTVLPDNCPELFTNRELANLMGLPIRTAAQLTYCLRGAGALSLKGRRGREYLFARTM